MAGYLTVKKTASGECMFKLHAGNHDVVLTSESYKVKASSLGGIESVGVPGQVAARFERKTAPDRRWALAVRRVVVRRSRVHASSSRTDTGKWSLKPFTLTFSAAFPLGSPKRMGPSPTR